MNAQELESRIVAAEKDPTLVRQLLTDFKADKDQQLSDLTGLVNTANTDRDAAIATKDKAVADVQKSFGEYKAKVDFGIATIHNIIADEKTPTDEGIKNFLFAQTVDGKIAAAKAKIEAAQNELAELTK